MIDMVRLADWAGTAGLYAGMAAGVLAAAALLAYAAARVAESGVIGRIAQEFRRLGVARSLVALSFFGVMMVSAQKRKTEEGPPGGVRSPGHEDAGGAGTPRGGEGPADGRVVFQSPVAFSGAGPVCFTGSPGLLVQTVIVSVRGDLADLSTLVDAPDTARLRVAVGGSLDPEATEAERLLTARFTAGNSGDPGCWVVVEVDLGEPVPLERLCFGGSAGLSAEWGRCWQGEIGEAVFFSAPPAGDARAGVMNWVAARGGFGRGYPATAAQRQAAMDAGLKYGLVWSTVIIVR